VDDIKRLFASYPDWQRNVEIKPMFLDEYARQAGGAQFDVVLCEGVLSGVPNPEEILRQTAGFVAPGGVLVITCIDPISYFPDTLRRLCAQCLIRQDQSLQEQVALLLPVFGRHLARLKGMSRPHEDWIIDNLINSASIGRLCSIPEAIMVAAGAFTFYASSPHFVTDWRWYKAIAGELTAINQMAIDQYWQQVHNFLDAQQLAAARPAQANRMLHELCRGVRDALREFETRRQRRLLQAIRDQLREVAQHIEDFSPEIAEAVNEVRSWLIQEPPDVKALAEAQRFGGWFGRGQQYVSFIRNATTKVS
jgi:SAM-dependent methyltransferase